MTEPNGLRVGKVTFRDGSYVCRTHYGTWQAHLPRTADWQSLSTSCFDAVRVLRSYGYGPKHQPRKDTTDAE